MIACSSLSIQIDTIEGLLLEGYSSWSETAKKGTSEIELAFYPFSRFNTDLYGRNRTKPLMQSEIQRVLARCNTPTRLVSFPTIRYVYETSAYSKRCESNSRYTNYERPTTSGLRFLTLIPMEDLDQRCDRRVESDHL